MATLPYEALIRFDDDGNFKAGHTVRRDPATGRLSDAQAIGKDTDFPWASISAEINVAALTRVTALEAEVALLSDVKAVVEDPTLDDAATVEAIKVIYVEKERPEKDKKRLELQKERDRIQAEIDKLETAAVEAATKLK